MRILLKSFTNVRNEKDGKPLSFRAMKYLSYVFGKMMSRGEFIPDQVLDPIDELRNFLVLDENGNEARILEFGNGDEVYLTVPGYKTIEWRMGENCYLTYIFEAMEFGFFIIPDEIENMWFSGDEEEQAKYEIILSAWNHAKHSDTFSWHTLPYLGMFKNSSKKEIWFTTNTLRRLGWIKLDDFEEHENYGCYSKIQIITNEYENEKILFRLASDYMKTGEKNKAMEILEKIYKLKSA